MDNAIYIIQIYITKYLNAKFVAKLYHVFLDKSHKVSELIKKNTVIILEDCNWEINAKLHSRVLKIWKLNF